jgi:multiple antibiotic resistance protein
VDLTSAVVTLFLIMDPLGNVPLFLSVLRLVPPERRRVVLLREIGLAYLVLVAFLLAGRFVMPVLHIEPETISISGGIVLFLIALRMIFPGEKGLIGEPLEGEPFLVPLAIPLFAGPSTLAALLLLQRTARGGTGGLLLALTIAWAASGIILLASTFFYRVLRERGLVALERLMGMVLVMLAVQMLMNGLAVFLRR